MLQWAFLIKKTIAIDHFEKTIYSSALKYLAASSIARFFFDLLYTDVVPTDS